MKNMFSRLVKFVPLSRIIPVVIIFLFSHTTNIYATYYAKFTAKVASTSTGMGKVYVGASMEENTDNYKEEGNTVETGSSGETQVAYLFAQSNNGYYFVNWKKEGDDTFSSNTQKAQQVTVDATDHTSSSNRADGGTYVAYFTPVLVNSGSNATTAIAVSDIYQASNSLTTDHTNTGTVSFSVKGADAIDDFHDPEVSGAGFSYKSMEYINNDTIKVTVQYQDQNIDNVNGSSKPDLQATVTLQSKGDTDGSNKKTATINASSSLKPAFTINPSAGKNFIDLTPSTPMDNDETVSTTLAKVLDNSASTTSAINVLPTNNVANAGAWSIAFENATDAEAKGYSVSADGQTVSFKPTTTYHNTVDVTTVLYITCTYTDSQGKKISTTQYITISADAGKIITIENESDGLMLTDATMTIDVPHGTSGDAISETTAFLTTLNSITQTPSSEFPTEYVSYSLNDNKTQVSISVKNTMPIGQHTHSITYTADGVTAVLNLIINVRLEKPVVVATTGIGQSVKLTWQEVYGATSYIVKSGTTTITTISETPLATSYTVTTINNQVLTTGKEYPFTVTAVCASNSFGNNTSEEVKATPSVPASITRTNLSSLKLYTGTDESGSFPYKAKTPIDLTHTFDDSGNALFDYLYIFGITTNTSGGTTINTPSKSVACNAKTPCYVYTKNAAGNGYESPDEFDAVMTRFDHETNMNGKKLYFTGYSPFTNVGIEPTKNGWMYFRGGDATVDIYLEDCEMIARYKTPTGKNSGYNHRVDINGYLDKLSEEQVNYFDGFSSIFVFNSTSTSSSAAYKPSIHIRGNNHLKGQVGTISEVYLCGYMKIFGEYQKLIEEKLEENIPIMSSPITIKPDKNNGYTDLTMDDLWPKSASTTDKQITNGYIKLDSYKYGSETAERTPCVDLGSEYGKLTINGGQYHMRNSSADNAYTCNLAVSYRKYAQTMMGITGSFYGFGTDRTDCQVIINSGTFTMYPNMLTQKGVEIGAQYYLDPNFLDLRFPAGMEGRESRINGGTFNGISHVLVCSNVLSSGTNPTNGRGRWLCLQDVQVNASNTSYGTATFDMPDPFTKGYNTVDPMMCYDLTEENQVSTGYEYGAQSLNAYKKEINGVETDIVRLLLPGQACNDGCEQECEYIEEAIYYSWVTAVPTLELQVNYSPISAGGDTEAKITPAGESVRNITNYLMYADMEGLQGFTGVVEAGEGTEVKIKDNVDPWGQITNTASFQIEKGLNMLKSVEADTWYCFVAPYDIHNVYVMELGESQVSSQVEDADKTAREKAIELQAEKNLALWERFYYEIFPDATGRTAPKPFQEVLGGAATIVPLYHYNGTASADDNFGTNLFKANYYLYELENETFKTSGTGDQLAIKWIPVKREGSSGQALMEQGEVYAIQFPYCPMCNDLDDRDYYDYWTNKYIYFYGKGPQMVQGSEYHSTILDINPSEEYATLVGNSTFADYTLSEGYVHETDINSDDRDFFVLKTNETIKPTQGYMLYTPTSPSQMPIRISRSGKIEYPDGTTTDADGVPTIGDRQSLMLYDALDGFDILALLSQVVTVYDMQGNLIFRQQINEGGRAHIPAVQGLYVVKGEYETIKVMVD